MGNLYKICRSNSCFVTA